MKELVWHFDQSLDTSKYLMQAVQNLISRFKTVEDSKIFVESNLDRLNVNEYADFDSNIKKYFELYFNWRFHDMKSIFDNIDFAFRNNQDYIDALKNSKQHVSNESRYSALLDYLSIFGHSLNKLINLEKPYDLNRMHEIILRIAELKPTTPPGMSEFKMLKKIWSQFLKARNDLIKNNFQESEWFEDHQVLKLRMKTLIDFSFLVDERFSALKIKYKTMDFDDMEIYALKILKDTRFNIAQRYKTKIKEILVDEFQDTNETQNYLVELISNGNNIFRVGDVKQSIYRFRNAQPQLMERLINLEDENHMVLYLDENYRSKESIVNYNNLLFNELMNFSELESYFRPEDFVKIGVPSRQSGGEAVELHLIESVNAENDEDLPVAIEDDFEELDTNDEDEEEVKQIVEVDPNAEPKAIHILNTIEEMKRNGPFQKYSDYVVLVRSNNEKRVLKKIFEKANVPHHISAKTGFFNANAIQDILLMLKAVINPYDDLNFVGLLLSHFVQLSENDLALLALEKGKNSFFEQFCAKFPDQASVYLNFKETNKHNDILELLRAIYAYNNYYDEYCDEQNRANLDLLFDKSILYRKNDLSIVELIHQIEKIEDNDSTEAIPYTEEDDVVRVMTIHQSKGLEFKVVLYLTKLNTTLPEIDSPLLTDAELGFMLKTIQFPKLGQRSSPIRLAIEMKARLDEVKEQIRMVYVALTRAVDKLIIVADKPEFVVPLNYSNVLEGMGSTNLILSGSTIVMGQVDFIIKNELVKQQFLKYIYPEIKVPKFENKKMLDASIEFRTPSSTHTTFDNIHLSFEKTTGTNYGTLVHTLFERLPIFNWNETLLKKLEPDLLDEDILSLMYFYNHPIYQDMCKGQIFKEYAFHSLNDGIVLHGYIDLFSVLEDQVIIVDYKTDRVTNASELNELYRDQLLGYKEVLSRLYTNKNIHVYAYSVKHKEFVLIK